jgi:hypothetical protein
MLLSMAAAIPALLMPLAASCQLAKEKAPASTTEPTYKYEAFAGFGYTSINQVNQSESGLGGVSLSFTRDFGRYFGVTAEGGHYLFSITRSNPTKPTVDQILVGPVFHAPLYDNVSIFVHGLIGAVHTGGISIQPDESFAGGIGVGLDYSLSPHFGLRAYGDDIGSAFTITPYQSGDSPHTTWSAHAAIGVTYKF